MTTKGGQKYLKNFTTWFMNDPFVMACPVIDLYKKLHFNDANNGAMHFFAFKPFVDDVTNHLEFSIRNLF